MRYVLDTIIKKLAHKHIQNAYQDGFSNGLVFAQEYYEGKAHDEYIKNEVEKVVNSQQTEIDKFRELDSFLTWVKLATEISDSDYFRSYIFELNTVEEIQNLLEYIDYLSQSPLIKDFYPETYEYLFELHISVEEVLENKIMLSKVERLVK